jgi:hypothetical protein
LFNTFLIKTNPIFILTINGLLVIFLKIGFSRADHYIDYFIGPVAIMSMLFSISRNKLWILLSTFVLGLLFLLGNLSIYPGVLKLPTLRIHADFSKSVSDRAAERYQQYKIPNNVITMIGQQSIDVYPYLNEYMIANKLNYRHRPSFQNYMTLTPKLDKLMPSSLRVLRPRSLFFGQVELDAYERIAKHLMTLMGNICSTKIPSPQHRS